MPERLSMMHQRNSRPLAKLSTMLKWRYKEKIRMISRLHQPRRLQTQSQQKLPKRWKSLRKVKLGQT